MNDWQNLLAGGAIGVACTLLTEVARRTYSYVRHLSDTGRRKYVGTYHVYTRSTVGDGSIAASQLSIKYSRWSNKLIAEEVQLALGSAQSMYHYKGFMSEQEGVVRTVSMRDPTSGERVTYMLLDRLHAPVDATNGIFTSWDLDGRPVASSVVLSRTPLSDEELELLLDAPVIRPRTLPRSLGSKRTASPPPPIAP